MVSVRKKTISGQSYYYLEHSYRKSGSIIKKEKYLGKKVPNDLEEVKKQFFYELSAETWFAKLDEIKENYSKEVVKLPSYIREKEAKSFSVRFTFDSNKIEGSKLTLRETASLIQEGTAPKEKPMEDVKEAESHYNVFLEMMGCSKDLSFQLVLEWYKKLFQATKPEIAGKLREHQVAISGSKFLPPLPVEVYALTKEFFKWYDKNKKKHAVELAALVHLKFVSIHPFADGNGRISRLLMNFVLHKRSFPMLNIRYEKRNSYYTALERAQTKENDSIFLNWFYKRYCKEHEKYA